MTTNRNDEAKWDRQIEEDSLNGKLQKLFDSLKPENAGRGEIPLKEILDDADDGGQ